MNIKPLSSLLGIILLGQATAYQMSVVERYSPFINENVQVTLQPMIGNSYGAMNCGIPASAKRIAVGCTYWSGERPARIEVSNDQRYEWNFEFALIHEVMHWTLRSKDEVRVDRAAKSMIEWRNNL